jgi:hypothetical protein
MDWELEIKDGGFSNPVFFIDDGVSGVTFADIFFACH